MESGITLDEIIDELKQAAESLGKNGRIELVIYQTNHVLANYELRIIKRKDGRITLHAKN